MGVQEILGARFTWRPPAQETIEGICGGVPQPEGGCMTEGQGEAQQETKEQKFSRLATKRTQAALGKIKLIGNLASSSYGYTNEQAGTIIGSLRQAIDQLENRFNRVRGAKVAPPPFALN